MTTLLLPEDGPETTAASLLDPVSIPPDTATLSPEGLDSPNVDTEAIEDLVTDTLVVAPARLDDDATVIPWSAESGRDSLFVQVAIHKRKDFTFGDGTSVKWQTKMQKGILYHPMPKEENERQMKELFPQPLRTEVVSLIFVPFLFTF